MAIFLDKKLYFECKRDKLKFLKDNDKEYISFFSSEGEE
jgi:hypothetical protein